MTKTESAYSFSNKFSERKHTMNLQFGARLKIPLKPEHLALLTDDTGRVQNAAIVTDAIFGDTYLAVNTNNGSDKTQDDQRDVIEALRQISKDASVKHKRETFYRENIYELQTQLNSTVSDANERALKKFELDLRVDITTPIPSYERIRKEALNSPKAKELQQQIDEKTGEMDRLYPEPETGDNSAFNQLIDWVEKQFLEFDGLYRDKTELDLDV